MVQVGCIQLSVGLIHTAGNVCKELNFAICDFDGILQTFCPPKNFLVQVHSSEVLCKPQTLNLQTLLFTTNHRI